MPWNPDCYLQFQAERFAPFADLLALVSGREGLRVVDLGCGTGELTRRLAEHLPESEVVGVDSSAEMLARAELLSRPGLKFEEHAIEDVRGKWDVVFSHAALQWVDDHELLIPRLLSLVKPKGQLCVQLPSNQEHATHRIITEIAREDPFRAALGGWTRHIPVLRLSQYADLLYQHGGTDIIAFEKIYPHILKDADALVEWTSGTALVPYFERLTGELRAEFLKRYRARLRKLWRKGPVFYSFQRILFSARLP